jgi:exonuclease SbcC
MRPHKLTISGFLSYGGCEEIDFDTLASAGGLFLIQGTTGAGKTSILDALAFALYGTLPGSRKAAAKTYRSDFAESDTITYVELEVTLRGDRYSIYRVPPYDKPKKNGDGTTPQKSELKIKKMVNDQWQPFSSTTQEGGDALTELIGLDSSQFFKLILLPQGDFAKFLQSSGKERQEILEKLFSDEVDKFIALTDHFWDVYNAAMKADADSAVRVQSEIQLINQTFATIYSDSNRDLTLAVPNSSDLTKAYLTALTEVKEKGASEISAAEAAKDAALEREKAANTLFENSEAVTKAKERLVTTKGVLSKWREDNKEILAMKVKDDQVIAEINSMIEAENEKIAAIKAANEKIDGLISQRSDAERAETKVESAKSELTTFEDDVKADDEEIKTLEKTVNGDNNPEAELAKNDLAIKELADQISLVEKWQDSEKAVVTLTTELQNLITARDKAITEYEKVQHAFDAAQASVLAEKLEEGGPCPVCGSKEHPKPAKSSGAATKDEVNKTLKASQSASEKVAGKESELKSAINKSEELIAGKGVDLKDLKGKLETLREKTGKFKEAIAALSQSRKRLQELKTSQEKNAAEREKLTSAVASATTALNGFKVAVTKAEKSLKIEPGEQVKPEDIKPIESKVSNLRSLAQKYEPLLSNFKAAESAEKALTVEGADEVPDIKEAKAAREVAEAHLKSISLKAGRLKSLETELKKIEKSLRAAEVEQKKAKIDVEKYERLAKHFMGKTGDKITLVSYFLGQRLHQILERANIRLQTMTRGQFSLQPNHEKKGAGQNYLSISVLDSWNQGLRDANSLSGGETFTTSLALAFGLADVVTSEAGGQSLDSLFIDEGFGSLDPDYLQAVMQSLEELRESGRVVGLISHVEEMKQRISMQLLVSKDGTIGTKVKIIENIGG